MKYQNIAEEELKNKVGKDWFHDFDTTQIIGKIDFSVYLQKKLSLFNAPLVWAEAKRDDYDIKKAFAQLILTIGKARTFDSDTLPIYLAAFNGQEIAFVPCADIQNIFNINDFNWNVAPSNHNSKEFNIIIEAMNSILSANTLVFDFENDEKGLKEFIKDKITKSVVESRIRVDKNNFITIYLSWLKIIKPIIDADWQNLNSGYNILDTDFYLADLFVDDKDTTDLKLHSSVQEKLLVVFQNEEYKIFKKNFDLLDFDSTISIKDKEIYKNFWQRYKRPPLDEFHDYIIERRDLLVPQDIRERKGAFFTPKQWVELSQQYLADALGQDWQEEYYIWDCAAGTGNLLAGLSNKYNIFASTLDHTDVNVMHERISNGANMLKNQVFQFDFLNDDFDKLPQTLQDIINDEEKRKKLVIYINPPYVEATNARTISGSGVNRSGVTTSYDIKQCYNERIGKASNELFALFMAVVYDKIPNCTFALFSTLKFVQGSNFRKFKTMFLADYLNGFIAPANTFDNVSGNFPIGFTIWNLDIKNEIKEVKCNVYNNDAKYIGRKTFRGNLPSSINKWISQYNEILEDAIGTLFYRGNDFQNQNYIYINTGVTKAHDSELYLNKNNIVVASIYFSVRHCIKATWINDRDQFLSPNNKWKKDDIFKTDCLTYTLFHSQNRIKSNGKANHWIPFTAEEVNSKERFLSSFMTDFISGKVKANVNNGSIVFPVDDSTNNSDPLVFSETAKLVFAAGKNLWSYYHSKNDAIANASLYEIREHFQGKSKSGKMNNRSEDNTYTELIKNLRNCLRLLAINIEPKVYKYGFLKR